MTVMLAPFLFARSERSRVDHIHTVELLKHPSYNSVQGLRGLSETSQTWYCTAHYPESVMHPFKDRTTESWERPCHNDIFITNSDWIDFDLNIYP
jgi:hypothetical protein